MENKNNYVHDPEFTGYMNVCVDNLILEVNHLKDFLADKDESYIRSNPDEVISELINSGLTASHINGAYCTLDAIRETGMPARIMFRDEEGPGERRKNPNQTEKEQNSNESERDI